MSDTSGFQEVRTFPSRSQVPIGSFADNRIIQNCFLAPFSTPWKHEKCPLTPFHYSFLTSSPIRLMFL